MSVWCHASRGARSFDALRRERTDLMLADVTQSVTQRIRRGASNENSALRPPRLSPHIIAQKSHKRSGKRQHRKQHQQDKVRHDPSEGAGE